MTIYICNMIIFLKSFIIFSFISSVHPRGRWLRSDRHERGSNHATGQSEADPRPKPLWRPVRSAGDVELQQEPLIPHSQLHQRAETAAAQQSNRYTHEHSLTYTDTHGHTETRYQRLGWWLARFTRKYIE